MDINRPDNSGATPLFIACQDGSTQIVKLLLNDQRIDINKAKENEETPFYIACSRGYIEIVKLLLNNEKVDFNKTSKTDGATPFWIACKNGHTDVVKLLFNDNRIDTKKPNFHGRTPFWIACRFKNIGIVKYLLAVEKEIIVNEKDNNVIEMARAREMGEQETWESEEYFQRRKTIYGIIAEFLELYERNPTETRMWLRIDLGFAGN